ncbi:uncharacterized protein BYT42DRAFT_542046 [Radiomyces spectabilis]|uniref:uncharacterized protein n=1 Tax=Radiomyces spectabilis TaxID=64574 RepID=UPI002220BAE2|nr:uncharacterized protein BYT42DRAFT_542046 [Radiomyces spectabilis]KAI8393849.1 hypothetical protein BYT42DRAFT_542046 [Radiomyces spectabilis]
MAIHGIEPTSQTYMQLLMGEILHKPVRRDTLRNIQSWFDKLLALEARRNYKRTGSKLKRIFTLMAYVGHPATRDLFLKSLSVNIKYDLDSWNLAILACARGGQLDAAEDLLQMLRRQSGTTADGPTLESYHHVIRGYLGHYDSSHFDSPFRKQPDVDAAIRIFQLMLKDNVVADYTVYASFLKAYASDNLGLEADEELRIETLQRLWQAMMTMSEKDTVHFDDALLESLIDIFTRHNALSYAEQIYWDIRQREHPISRRNLSSIHQLIIAFARRVQLLSAMSLFYDLMACGHRPSSLVMCEIIRACGKRNDIELAEQMLSVVEETQKATDPILRVAKSCHHALKIQRDTARRQCTSSIS